MLYNGRLTINTLMSKSFPNAELAILSACQTAAGDEQLSDEAVHLVAWMLNIGYKTLRKECNEMHNWWDWLPFVHFGL